MRDSSRPELKRRVEKQHYSELVTGFCKQQTRKKGIPKKPYLERFQPEKSGTRRSDDVR